ncbi:MAG TPA: PQQ-binding-like beta-propeller repeat protein [Candidatus Brocadiia bacterium]|nr:PQQ-binding-like beta-propeller repeat protein [Candidatus Brocadiia bacterium]
MSRRFPLGLAFNILILAAGAAAGFWISGRRQASAPAPVVPPPPESSTQPPEPGFSREQAADEWPFFRGPSTVGLAKDGVWPTAWDAASGQNILWTAPLPGPGKSSPVVWGNRVFVTSGAENSQAAHCFDLETGQRLWSSVVPAAKRDWPAQDLKVLADTGYAAPTPAVDGRRLYVTYASADVAALEAETGRLLWSRNLGRPDSAYGLASSLVLHGNLVILQLDRGADESAGLSSLIAMDTATGKTVWQSARPVPNSWSTPILVGAGAAARLITTAAPWVMAYDPASGREVWRARALSGDVAPSAAYADGVAYVTNEYAQVAAIRADGQGDVSATHIAWTSEEGMSDASSPVCGGGFLLQAHSSGRVTCFEAAGGKLLWDKELKGQFWASPVLAGGRAYLSSDRGVTYIFTLGPAWAEPFQASVGEAVYGTPAFVRGRIILRGEKRLFCVGVKQTN